MLSDATAIEWANTAGKTNKWSHGYLSKDSWARLNGTHVQGHLYFSSKS